MASLFLSGVALGLAFCVVLMSPAHSLTCTSQTFKDNKLYDKCADLPTLGSYLHYTYNATNSSLSVAFISTPASSDGWIAWAINPTGTGMVGSQALIAFKSDGSLKVKTYNISSYSSIVESKLSFDTWDLSAESGKHGAIIIYGSLRVPESAEKLNQVWQVGAKVSDGHPDKHAFAPENLNSKGTLTLTKTLSPSSAPSPSPSPSASVSPTSGGPPPNNGGQSVVRTSKIGLFVGLFLFFGSVFGL